MSRPNINTAKAALAAAFPGVTFSFHYEAPQSPAQGHAATWTGGPSEYDVRQAGRGVIRYTNRIQTAAEIEALWSETPTVAERGHYASRCSREQSEATRLKRLTTMRERQRVLHALYAAYPDVAFRVKASKEGHMLVQWTGGPDRYTIARTTNLHLRWCTRNKSWAEIQQETAHNFATGHNPNV